MPKNAFDEAMLRYYREIVAGFDAARLSMRKMLAHSQDWTAKIQMEEEFNRLRNLQEDCRDFLRHQLGVNPPRQ